MTRQRIRQVLAGLSVILLATPAVLEAATRAGSADAVIARPVRTLLAADANRTVIRITFPVVRAPIDWQTVSEVAWTGLVTEDWNRVEERLEPVEPQYGCHVALADRQTPTWRVAAIEWYRRPSDDGTPVVSVLPPAVYRGVPLAIVQVNVEAGGGILAGIVVEVDHPAPAGLARAAADPLLERRLASEPVPGSVANPEHFRDLRAVAITAPRPAAKAPLPDFFQLAQNWVRLDLRETGVYRLTGQELAAMGLSLADVDPAKLRLYKGGGLPLADDPEVSDDEQADRVGLTEVAIVVEDGGDGEFDADDRLLFYGFGADAWRDRFAPTTDKLAFYNHPSQDTGVYWLTWENLTTPTPLPGTPRRVPTIAAGPTGGEAITTHRARLHGEYNYVYLGGYVRDNWVWQSLINSSFSPSVTVPGAVAGAPADWQVDICATYDAQSGSGDNVASCWLNNDRDHETSLTWGPGLQLNREQVRLAGTTISVEAGTNVVHLLNEGFAATGRYLAFDSFDLLYTASLDKRAFPGALACVLWGDEVTVPGTPTDVVFTLPATGTLTVWDVSQPDSAVALGGDLTGGDPRLLTVGLARDPGLDRHLVLFEADDLLSVPTGRLQTVVPLRQTVPAADFLVIHPAEFAVAAGRLAALRERTLPGVEAPVAVAVDVADIFANFSGGQKDWRAIRQFIRWAWLAHGQRLRWVCLLGDASRDTRNFQGRNPQTDLVDWIPTDLVTDFPYSLPLPLSMTHPYVTDESLVALDAPAILDGQGNLIPWDIPDLAIGRLPATGLANALALVDRTGEFVEEAPPGAWRNRLVYCADDLRQRPSNPPSTVEAQHMLEADTLATRYTPLSLDLAKVYLEDYPYVGNYKPEARRELLAELDAGTTMFYYVGHGAASVLADEQVFLSDFIPGLTNGGRRFVFVAFSCDVGVFDDPASQSMAELFLSPPGGGGIAGVAASWVSSIYYNNDLSEGFWSALFPNRHVSPTMTLGEALVGGKVAIWTNATRVRNARRYNFIGDPALRLPHPVDDLAFTATSADSLLTGRLHEIRVDLSGSGLAPGAQTTYDLSVEESGVLVNFYQDFYWQRLGNPAFRGAGTVPDDLLVVPFLAPIRLRTGDTGRLRCIVSDGDAAHAAVLRVPVVQVSAETSGDVTGPDIRLAFGNGRTYVRPGDALTASLYDTSGVNILASNPANSVLLEFDRSGIYTNVTDAVVFAPGSYTRASLVTSLPGDLDLGPHTVVLTASDMFGNVGADTLQFQLEAASAAGFRNATVFPNPTVGPCRLVCDLSGPMDLQWDIYTVAGRRVRSLRAAAAAAGPVVLEWDGPHGEGDEISNGVYLYVLRGSLDADGHDIHETGQLVIMR